MTIKDWIETMSRSGLVCSDYMRKISAADSREDIFRVLCDANGGNWLFEQHAKNVPLPIDEFCNEFSNYLNGKRVMEYPQGYTSSFYCRHEDKIWADTTIVYLLDCKDANVWIPMNKYPTIVLSKGSSAKIVMCAYSRLNIEIYGDAEYDIEGDMSRVRITRH